MGGMVYGWGSGYAGQYTWEGGWVDMLLVCLDRSMGGYETMGRSGVDQRGLEDQVSDSSYQVLLAEEAGFSPVLVFHM